MKEKRDTQIKLKFYAILQKLFYDIDFSEENM